MLDMSPAAGVLSQPFVSESEKKHYFYPQYVEYVRYMTRLGVRADGFSDYVYQQNAHKTADQFKQMPEYADFLAWMRDTQAGARKCRPSKDSPHGLSFPDNFKVWLSGERW